MSAFVYPSSSGGGGGGGGPCGACKFLRRKCTVNCIFAPYFNSENGAANFATVHKVFGASNVSKLLIHIPVHQRMDAVSSICYEAQARMRDPVYGCVSYITSLQQQVRNLEAEIARLQGHISLMQIRAPVVQQQPNMAPPSLPFNHSFLIEPTDLHSPIMGQTAGQLASTSTSTADYQALQVLQGQGSRFSSHMPYTARSSST